MKRLPPKFICGSCTSWAAAQGAAATACPRDEGRCMSEVIDLALARRRLAIERAGRMAPADWRLHAGTRRVRDDSAQRVHLARSWKQSIFSRMSAAPALTNQPPATRTFESGAFRYADKIDFDGHLSPFAEEVAARYMHEHRLPISSRLRATGRICGACTPGAGA
jgi:hypothetical protein